MVFVPEGVRRDGEIKAGLYNASLSLCLSLSLTLRACVASMMSAPQVMLCAAALSSFHTLISCDKVEIISGGSTVSVVKCQWGISQFGQYSG